MNDYSPRAMELAEKYLKALKPNIAGWEADFGKEMMTKNKAWLNMTWSGDAIWAIEDTNAVGVDLDYEVPEEGSNIWYDGWVIPKYARNPEVLKLFYQLYVSSGYSLAEYGFLRICKFHSYSRNTGREDRHHSSLLFRFKLLFRTGCRQRAD